jgi:hypothetical protein
MVKDRVVDYDETARVWRILTKTHKGLVSIIKDLDAPTARQVYQRLKPEEHPKDYINLPKNESFGWCQGVRTLRDNDITQVDVLGPENWYLDPWRGVTPRIIDMAPEVERQKREWERQDLARMRANKKAKELNLLEGLSYFIVENQSRCSCCKRMKPSGTVMSYVKDTLKRSDPLEAFLDRKRSGHWSGSAWCQDCLPKNPKVKTSNTLSVESNDTDQIIPKYETISAAFKRWFKG